MPKRRAIGQQPDPEPPVEESEHEEMMEKTEEPHYDDDDGDGDSPDDGKVEAASVEDPPVDAAEDTMDEEEEEEEEEKEAHDNDYDDGPPTSSKKASKRRRRSLEEGVGEVEDENEKPAKDDYNNDDEDYEDEGKKMRSTKKSKKAKKSKEDVQAAAVVPEPLEDDNNLEEEEEEEEKERGREVANSIKRKAVNEPGKPAEAGIISEIYLENFMCHAKLRIKLGRNANAITGDNGSGKSAVLAAIQICLGANARRTHRARNLKELVRREGAAGRGSAKIQVTLLNGGPDGYKQDVYGETITVQRCISLGSGNSGFALLDHRKREQSTSKKELISMLDHLNIQVENPVSILDQEESKKFLCGKPEDKYRFFMKATDLERMDNNYAATIDQLRELETAKVRAEESLESLRQTEEYLKQRWKRHDAVQRQERKVEKARCELLWALYNEANEAYRHSLALLKECKDKIAKKEQDLKELEEETIDPNSREEKLQARTRALMDEEKEQTALKKSLEDEYRQANAPYKQAQSQLNQLNRELQAAKKEASAAQRRLKEYRDKMMAHEDSAESSRSKMSDQLKAWEDERDNCRDRVDPLKQAVSEALRAHEEAEPIVAEARDAVDRVSRQLHGAKRRLQELADRTNEFAVFGSKVKAVYDLVEKAKQSRKFRGKVIGPIGKYVKIAAGKENFAALAEHAMGKGILDRFIVTCDSDLLLLNDLRRKAGCGKECGVFQQPPSRRYSVPAPAVEGTETIASVLSVSDEHVFNCLVDNAKIDQRALMKGKEVSEELLLVDNGNNTFRIRDPNIKNVYFLPKGDQWQIVGRGNMFLISNDNPELRASSIGADKREAIINAERDVAHLTEELKRLKAEDSKLENEHTQLQRQWNRANRAMQQNDDRINELSTNIENMTAEIQASVSVTFDPSEFEEDVAQTEAQTEQVKEKVERLAKELKNREPEVQDLKSRIAECDARNKKLGNDIAAVQDESQRLLETQTQTRTQVEKRKAKLEKMREKAESLETAAESSAADVAQRLLDARVATFWMMQQEKCNGNDNEHTEIPDDPTQGDLDAIDPIKVSSTSSKCKEKLKAQEAKVEKERQKAKIMDETREEAYENFINAQKARLRKHEEIQNLSTDIENMMDDLRVREKRHRDLRQKLKALTVYKFDELLNMNDYSGELIFDDGGDGKAGTLDLVVTKGAGGQTTDVKGLSGGERSYSTMCLLLALGEKLETPFRIFDEFDVFLDAQSRKLVMQQVIHTAKKLENRQFIFITPQDLSNLTTDDKFRIYKLNPPARHNRVDGLTQTTLNFGSQGNDA